MNDHLDKLPALDATPLPPAPGEWQRITGTVRRRHRRRVTATTALLVVGAAAPLALLWPNTANRSDVLRPAPTAAAIPGLRTYDPDTLGRDHVTGPIEYAQTPPVGGDHAGEPQQCGVYTAPIRNEHAVHSLEHGAVWITYQPTLGTDELQQLEALAESAQPWALMSPLPEQDARITITAWGLQLDTNDAADPRLQTFADEYANAPQAPEPDAPCAGTTATTP
jgi:hypothetical protein